MHQTCPTAAYTSRVVCRARPEELPVSSSAQLLSRTGGSRDISLGTADLGRRAQLLGSGFVGCWVPAAPLFSNPATVP